MERCCTDEGWDLTITDVTRDCMCCCVALKILNVDYHWKFTHSWCASLVPRRRPLGVGGAWVRHHWCVVSHARLTRGGRSESGQLRHVSVLPARLLMKTEY